MIRALALWAVLAGAGVAQDLPALHDVTGVAPGDVLNVRAAPMADAQALGALPPDARGVEVTALAPGGTWGRINHGETAGWVAMRFLARQPGPAWSALQTPLACSGTEPFWGLRSAPDGRGYLLEEAGQETIGLWPDWTTPPRRSPERVGLHLAGPSRQGFATLTAAECSDGMSDRAFGLAIELHITGTEGSAAPAAGFSGCCTLAP